MPGDLHHLPPPDRDRARLVVSYGCATFFALAGLALVIVAIGWVW